MTNQEHIIPQNYPLFAWYLDITRDEINDLKATVSFAQICETPKRYLCIEGPFRIVAWRVHSESVPAPIVTDVGEAAGIPITATNEDEAILMILSLARTLIDPK